MRRIGRRKEKAPISKKTIERGCQYFKNGAKSLYFKREFFEIKIVPVVSSRNNCVG